MGVAQCRVRTGCSWGRRVSAQAGCGAVCVEKPHSTGTQHGQGEGGIRVGYTCRAGVVQYGESTWAARCVVREPKWVRKASAGTGRWQGREAAYVWRQSGRETGRWAPGFSEELDTGENEKDPCPLGAPRNSDTPAAASAPRPRPLLLCIILH